MKHQRKVAREKSAAPALSRYGKYLWPGAAGVLLALAYWNSIDAQFFMDNAEMVRDNRIQSVTSEHLHRIFTQRYWEGMGDQLYRPAATLSYLFNYAVLGNGANPAGYHWFNLILHALNMLLVYRLGRAVFRQERAAAALSALWGLHPVLTESVTNVIGRSDMLAALGVLAATLAHRNALRSDGRRRAAWLAGAAAAAALGMFSKESAIAVIAIVVLWDLAFERDASWTRRVAGYAAVALPCVVFLMVRAKVLSGQPWAPVRFVDNPLTGADFWTARITAVKAIGRYVQLLVWPAGLSSDYSYNEIPVSWDFAALIAAAGCAAAAVAAIRSWRRNPAVFFFIAFFFAALAPVSNLILLIGTIFGERLVYLPSVGFAGVVVWSALAIERRRPAQRALVWGAVAAIAAAFAMRTSVRNDDWREPERFWTSAAAAAPGSYKNVMGAALSGRLAGDENLIRSLRGVERALAILDGLADERNVPMPYQQAGTFYRGIGDTVAAGQAGAALSARGAGYWYGKSLEALQRCERIEVAQDAVARRANAARGRTAAISGRGPALRELGRTYVKVGELGNAVAAFERGRAVGADPDLLEDLAAAYRAQGEMRKAALALVEALALDGSRGQLMPAIVQLYSAADPGGCAVKDGALNMECPLVHGDVCRASANVIAVYSRRGQEREAEALRRTAAGELGCPADPTAR